MKVGTRVRILASPYEFPAGTEGTVVESPHGTRLIEVLVDDPTASSFPLAFYPEEIKEIECSQ